MRRVGRADLKAVPAAGAEEEYICARCRDPQRAWVVPEDRLCDGCLRIVSQELAGQREREEQARLAEEQRQEASRRWAAWPETLSGFGVPAEYCRVPKSLKVPESCKGWRGEPWSITILGLTGRGKTWCATRIWGELACHLGEGVWADVTMAIEQIHSDIRSGRARTLDRLLWSPVLLLDDLLAERSDVPFVRDKLGFVLRTRYNNRSPTLITSNATDPDPDSPTFGQPSLIGIDQIDPEGRITSRLSTGIVVRMPGEDRRIARSEGGVLHGGGVKLVPSPQTNR